MEIDKHIKGYYPSGYYPNGATIKHYEHNKVPAYVAGDAVSYNGYVYVLTGRIGTAAPSYPDTQVDSHGFRTWTLYVGYSPNGLGRTWGKYLASLHNVIIDFDYDGNDSEEAYYNLELGTNPRPEHPEPVSESDDNTYISAGYGSLQYLYGSHWWLKRSEVRYEYMQIVPSYIPPYCTGIFDRWEKAEGNQMAEWEYLRDNNPVYPSFRLESIPQVGSAGSAYEGSISASPAYPSLEYTIPAYCNSHEVVTTYDGYEGVVKNTEVVITYNHRMKATSPVYKGRTYIGYLRYYTQDYIWRKYDSWDNRDAQVIECGEGTLYGGSIVENSWLIGVIDIYVQAAMPQEHRIPISYYITDRDIVGSDEYDDTPDMRSFTIPLATDRIIGGISYVLAEVSPDFSVS